MKRPYRPDPQRICTDQGSTERYSGHFRAAVHKKRSIPEKRGMEHFYGRFRWDYFFPFFFFVSGGRTRMGPSLRTTAVLAGR